MSPVFFPEKKDLPWEITSYDLLKMAAVLLMIVDHIGHYFFVDEMWFRVFGRMCVPMWFFLIGYARTRDIGKHMWIGMGLLVAANFVTGMGIFPLNILATMIFVRLVIDAVASRAARDKEIMAGISIIVVFLSLPTAAVWEYGTLGLLFAMLGWFMRNPDKLQFKIKGVVEAYILIMCVGAFGFIQAYMYFGFNDAQAAVLFAGLALVMLWLYRFRPGTYPKTSAALPGFVTVVAQFFGRRTLEIYVAHLIVFKFAALYLGDERFAWFRFDLLQ